MLKHSWIMLWVITLSSLAHGVDRPNIIVILLDDFGVGQFSPLAKLLKVEDLNPRHLEFVASLGDKSYAPQTALQMAQRAMPTMDRMATEGALFCNAFASSNLCAPSRQGILTGRRQIEWGAYRNMDVNICGMPPGSVLAGRLQLAGYTTGFIGKWHVGSRDHELCLKVFRKHGITETDPVVYPWADNPEISKEVAATGYNGSVILRDHPYNNGFDYYFGYNRWACPFYNSQLIWEGYRYTGLQTQYNTDLFTDKALNFIQGALDRDKPFFVQIAYHAMHDPLDPQAPPPYQKFHSGSEYLDKYFDHLYAVDQNIKRLLDYLKQRHHLDNTMIVFTADNGATCTDRSVLPGNAPYSGYKGSFRQGGFKVPMVVWFPSRFKMRGLQVMPVSTMDIMPTALETAGVTLPDNLDGKSLVSLLTGNPQKPIHDTFVWAGIHSRAWGFDRYLNPGKQDIWRDNSPGSWVVVKYPYLLRYITAMPKDLHPDLPLGTPPQRELYNINKDPLELHNLYFARRDIVAELRQIYLDQLDTLPEPPYQKWSKQSWQPLLHPTDD